MLASPEAPVADPAAFPFLAPSVKPPHSALWTDKYLPVNPNGLTFIDIFCGAGGSSLGMVAAGYELVLAANHWEVAIRTHKAAFSDAEHLCRDVNAYDMRRLPPADVLWASPICWEVSQAGGNNKPDFAKYRALGQRDLFDAIDDPEDEDGPPEPADSPGFEKTRATAYDVLRAAEVWRYKAILVENVVGFVWKWNLFEWWLKAFERLGYQAHIVCVNSAHIEEPDNPAAPQWRDRLYIIFLPVGVTVPPDAFAPRPVAHCFECGEDVRAVQYWRPTKKVREYAHIGKIGKYKSQYDYRCPNPVQHDDPIVEPYVRPAASVINWSNVGCKIGEREALGKEPLRPKTWEKILKGLDMMRSGVTLMQVTRGGHNGRLYRPQDRPFASRTTKIGDGIVVPPYMVELRGGASVARSAWHPYSTMTANGRHHGLVTSGVGMPIDAPSWGDGHGLVIPYRNEAPTSSQVPFHTMATKDSAALLFPQADVDPLDLYYRMIFPAEQLLAQRFPREYRVLGTGEQRTMQAGNAVSSNVPQWLGRIVSRLLFDLAA